ncbi:MAG TPA: ATP-dependent helicase, partial [Streptosporangiaceae bacterium]|nr:ATP-dependent helicase [Streptosporangiaceae bacterium]
MRVIHGIWARGALCLWAEDPDLPAAPRDQAPSPAPHPFACQAAELADVLAALPGPAGEAARKAVDAELTLQLPSAASPTRPLASPELIRSDGPEPRAGRVRLARWRVPVLAFGPAAALDLL